MALAESSPILPPSGLAALLVILAASCGMFLLLIWRWTSRRGWVELSDWAINHGFRLEGPRFALCSPAVQLLPSPAPQLSLGDGVTQLQRIRTPLGPGTRIEPGIWHVLVRQLQTGWPLTILRPASRPTSLVDFWPLASMYTLWPGERFVLYGQERKAVQALGASLIRGLLPPDIGLVLSGPYLILDFSARPFDPLELDRMVSLAEQIITHLPVLAQGPAGA
jgi:hypothetical protein